MKKSNQNVLYIQRLYNTKSTGVNWRRTMALTLFFMVFMSTQLLAQTNQITGSVTDSAGEPLPGVNIVVKNTTSGTITDIDGKFQLDVGPTDILLVSFIGYTSKEVPVNNQSSIIIVLTEETLDVDEVVVVGYGVQKKSLTTAAISSVKGEELQSIPVSRADQAMQGRTAGISVLSTSGSPGAGAKIRVRGVNSNGDANPLFIVDGMKTDDINNIDPGDIESMEILKDAASAAIYGTEGANGVVIITTKSGKEGAAQVNYNFQYAIQSARSKTELMNAEEYATWMDESGAGTVTLDGTDTD